MDPSLPREKALSFFKLYLTHAGEDENNSQVQMTLQGIGIRKSQQSSTDRLWFNDPSILSWVL